MPLNPDFNNCPAWKTPAYISALPHQRMGTAFPRNLVLLGSTGSIGRSCLAVLENLSPEEKTFFPVLALAGGKNIELLARQAQIHRPAFLAVQDIKLVEPLQKLLPTGYKPEILAGPEGFARLAGLNEAQVVLSAQVGAAGLTGTLSAAQAGKIIALANKESLVLAGELIRNICAQTGAVILPVDSEHNAIFQVLMERFQLEPVKILLTASGGPFRGRKRNELANISPENALKHPNWSMGAKISIDSATLMNKGLEVIEACYLYGLPLAQVEVVLHPQSIVHSAICFKDGSIIAQMGTPDMRMPIAHALGWPRRISSGTPGLDLNTTTPLTFEPPDLNTFTCLTLAYQALQAGQGLPVILNAANEIAVAAFLNRSLPFLGIADLVEAAMQALATTAPHCEAEILQLDEKTRAFCLGKLKEA